MRLTRAYLMGLLVAIGAVGCGGGTPAPNSGAGGSVSVGGTGGLSGSDPKVVGNWQTTLNSICIAGANFGSDATYSLNTVCVLPDSSVALSSTTGTYSTTGDHLNFTAEKSTCSERLKLSYVIYSATATVLSMSDNVTVTAYARAATPTTGATATYGCFRNGAFTASPLAPL